MAAKARMQAARYPYAQHPWGLLEAAGSRMVAALSIVLGNGPRYVDRDALELDQLADDVVRNMGPVDSWR